MPSIVKTSLHNGIVLDTDEVVNGMFLIPSYMDTTTWKYVSSYLYYTNQGKVYYQALANVDDTTAPVLLFDAGFPLVCGSVLPDSIPYSVGGADTAHDVYVLLGSDSGGNYVTGKIVVWDTDISCVAHSDTLAAYTATDTTISFTASTSTVTNDIDYASYNSLFLGTSKGEVYTVVGGSTALALVTTLSPAGITVGADFVINFMSVDVATSSLFITGYASTNKLWGDASASTGNDNYSAQYYGYAPYLHIDWLASYPPTLYEFPLGFTAVGAAMGYLKNPDVSIGDVAANYQMLRYVVYGFTYLDGNLVSPPTIFLSTDTVAYTNTLQIEMSSASIFSRLLCLNETFILLGEGGYGYYSTDGVVWRVLRGADPQLTIVDAVVSA